MKCEMCGKEEAEFIIELEGTRMNVGNNCASFGKVIKRVQKEQIQRNKSAQKTNTPSAISKQSEDPIQIIVKNYGSLIKNAREKTGLTQEDFGKKINEKASLLHQIESGKIEPNLQLAKKFEKILSIKLIEEYYEEKKQSTTKQIEEDMTIGNLVNIKHRKK